MTDFNGKLDIKYTCPVCDCKKFKLKFSGYDYNFHISDNEYKIIECNECGLELIYPIPNKEEQKSFYPSIYYDKHLIENENKIKYKCIKMEESLFSIFSKRYFKLPNYDGNNKKTFLDIGCGDGKNVVKMAGKNRNSKGFEIGEGNYYDDDSNIYHADSINDVNFYEKYDVIRCNHVFEHIDNPEKFLGKIKGIMKEDGCFIVNLPNVKGLSGYIFGKYATERDIPRHIFGYNYKNIQKLFIKMGFKIIHKQRGRQFGSATSLTWFIVGKYGVDIRNYKLLYILLGFLFIPIEFILSLFGFTNSMGFVLKK